MCNLSNYDSLFCLRLEICFVCGSMDRSTRKFLFTVASVLTFYTIIQKLSIDCSTPKPHEPPNTCPFWISEQTITPLNNTKHLLVSAYMDQRVNGFDIRIIGMFRRDSILPLSCLFCCTGQLSNTTPATILQHSDNFGFPFATTDVMCQIPQYCKATHVSLVTNLQGENVFNQAWLPIRNQKTEGNKDKKLQFDFTVCMSNLFGGYNNVLQFAQSLEMYRSAHQQNCNVRNNLNKLCTETF